LAVVAVRNRRFAASVQLVVPDAAQRFPSWRSAAFKEDILNFQSHAKLQEHARKSYAWFTGIIGLSLADNGSITKGSLFRADFDADMRGHNAEFSEFFIS
jgi:hypothetical protein